MNEVHIKGVETRSGFCDRWERAFCKVKTLLKECDVTDVVNVLFSGGVRGVLKHILDKYQEKKAFRRALLTGAAERQKVLGARR